MAKVWKKLQRADGDFQGTWDGVAKGNVYHTANKPTKTDVGLSNVTNHAAYHSGNKPTKSDVGLANVTNESKATMFANPAFTGTPTGISKGDVGLGNVGNTSVADIRSGVTKSDVGLGNVTNESKATILSGTFTGDIGGTSAADIKSKAIAGEAAKSAVDGNANISMVGGSIYLGTISNGKYPFSVNSSGDLKIKDDEFQALSDGTVNCKGNFTIKQDSNGDSKIVLEGDNSGTAEVEVNGANPTFDLGGASPLGTSTLSIKRGGATNQARIFFYTGSSTKTGCIGFANEPAALNDQFAIHTEAIYDNTSPYKERALSFDDDGKMGMYANTKTVAGFTFGSDGTNKHVYIKNGGLGIGTTSISNGALAVDSNADIGGDLDVAGDATFQGSTDGISYDDLSDKPSIGGVDDNSITLAKMADNAIRVAELDTQNTPASGQFLQYAPSGTGLFWSTVPHMTDDGITLDRSGNDSYILFKEDGTGYGQIRSDKDGGGGLKLTNSGGSTMWQEWDSSGNVKIEKSLDVGGSAYTGWHTKSKIWIPPSDFVVNDDNAYGNLAMVDNGGQGKVMYSALEAYCNTPIPSGYKATHYRINGTSNVQIAAYYSDMTTGTASSCSYGMQYTNNQYSFYQYPVNADDTNGRYIMLNWKPSGTAQYLYGAYITIARI